MRDHTFSCFGTVPACDRWTDTTTAYTELAYHCMVKTLLLFTTKMHILPLMCSKGKG